MRAFRVSGFGLAAVLALAGSSACGDNRFNVDGNGGDSSADTPASGDGAVVDSPNGDAPPVIPLVLAVRPEHGPFNGGNTVTVRGSNFSDDVVIRFGDAMVQPRYQMFVDRNRIEVRVPAGVPGDVDVIIERGDQRSRLPRGYHYDSFYAEPNTASIAGGTQITVRGSGTNWTASTRVIIDEQPCENVMFISPSQLSCTVPAHAQGLVPVTVTTGSDGITVLDALNYYEASDPNSGGWGGGRIAGSINVATLNALTGDAIPGAYVYIGDNPRVAAPASGTTNPRGQVTLSVPDLRGPNVVTASAHCFATSSFVSIDGRDGTLFLMPWLARVPGVDCGMGMPPSGPPPRSIFAAQIAGELVWAGPREFGPNPWSINIPTPRANERRVAYVYTTTANMLASNPDPGMGAIVLETGGNERGRGYPYLIVARPAALAVYALAGLERTDTMPPRFTPYVMGVARSVLASPRASLTGVDIDMNIPLDHETTVQAMDLPPQVDGNPNRLQAENWIDLGGEGVIPRPDIAVISVRPLDSIRLVAQPAFLGTLADARMIVRATYGSGMRLGEPLSAVVVAGITSPDDTVRVRNWVGVPQIIEPVPGGTIPTTRRLRFNVSGNDPDMFWTMISQSGSSCSVGFYLGDVVWWQHFFPGSVREVGIPDISGVPGLTDMPRGIYQMSLCGFRVAGFDFNNFRYQWLSRYYWTAYATNSVTIAR